MTTFTSAVTSNPDFSGFSFYVEAGQVFDETVYEEAYGVKVPEEVARDLNSKAANLQSGEWLLVEHEA